MQIHLGQSTFGDSDRERSRHSEAPNSTGLIQMCGFTKARTPWHRMLGRRVRSRMSTLPVSTYTAPTSHSGDLWWRVSPKTIAAYSVPVANLVNEHRKRISGMIGIHERQRERKIPAEKEVQYYISVENAFGQSASLRCFNILTLDEFGRTRDMQWRGSDVNRLIASRLQHTYIHVCILGPLRLDVIPIDRTGEALIGACISWHYSR